MRAMLSVLEAIQEHKLNVYQAHSEISSEDCSAVAAGAKCPGYRAITP